MSKLEEVKLVSRLVSLVFELGSMHAANDEAAGFGRRQSRPENAIRGVTAVM